MQETNKQNALKHIALLILSTFFIASCTTDSVEVPQKTAYAFFAAGHVYGQPGVDNDGFHPPFTESIPFLNNYDKLDLGVFTGDIVVTDNAENWDQYNAATESLSMDTYIAAGNHDYKDTELFQSYFGNPNYFFTHNEDLFICLEVTTTGWNIRDESLDVLNEALATLSDSSQNVFLFVHQLIWFEENSKYTQCNPNSLEGREDNPNFRSEILPILENLNQQVIIYAGDIGAFENGCAVMYDQFNNIKLIASGMGGGKNDNLVITNIDSMGQISFDLVALNGDDKSALGRVQDYWIQ